MPTPPRSKQSARQQPRYDPQRRAASPDQRRATAPEMIDLVQPSWILKALGGIFVAAFLCAYITLCVLYAHAQWQLVLHPSRTVTATPQSIGLPFTEVHFAVDATGQPQIDGWYIPAAGSDTSTTATPATTPRTALLLHSGDGSMADALPSARLLHAAHLNVLLFDYRGFGHSGSQHPTQDSMQSDADTALNYLLTTRSTPIASIIVYGTGAGASLAVHLCTQYPTLPALILQSPDGDFTDRVRRDPRSKLVPVSLLFDQPFPLAKPLQTLPTPKLILLPNSTDPTPITNFLSTH